MMLRSLYSTIFYILTCPCADSLRYKTKSKTIDEEIFPHWATNPLGSFFANYTTGNRIWKWHHYFNMYHRHFSHLRAYNRPINMLAIGVQSGGEIAMWQSYFTNGVNFYGVDINPLVRQVENIYANTKIFIGSQSNSTFLEKLSLPPLDLIIDDGSHVPSHQIVSFNVLFDKLIGSGVYWVEDIIKVQTSFTHAQLNAIAYGGTSGTLTFYPLIKVGVSVLEKIGSSSYHTIYDNIYGDNTTTIVYKPEKNMEAAISSMEIPSERGYYQYHFADKKGWHSAMQIRRPDILSMTLLSNYSVGIEIYGQAIPKGVVESRGNVKISCDRTKGETC